MESVQLNLKSNMSTCGNKVNYMLIQQKLWQKFIKFIKALCSIINMFHVLKYQIVQLNAVVGNDWPMKALSMHIKSHIKKKSV